MKPGTLNFLQGPSSLSVSKLQPWSGLWFTSTQSRILTLPSGCIFCCHQHEVESGKGARGSWVVGVVIGLGHLGYWFFFSFLNLFVFFWLSCTTCGILVPWSENEPASSAVNVQSPNHWTAREFPDYWLLLPLRVDPEGLLCSCGQAPSPWGRHIPACVQVLPKHHPISSINLLQGLLAWALQVPSLLWSVMPRPTPLGVWTEPRTCCHHPHFLSVCCHCLEANHLSPQFVKGLYFLPTVKVTSQAPMLPTKTALSDITWWYWWQFLSPKERGGSTPLV